MSGEGPGPNPEDRTRFAGGVDPEVERLLAAAIAALRDSGPAGLDALLAAHPVQAGSVRRLVGLVTDASGVRAMLAPMLARIGDYELLERLGQGGMGVVYKARQVPFDRIVAVKVVRSDFSGDANAKLRFLREMRAVAKVDHPGIVRVFEAGEDQGFLYFSMEFVSGPTLASASAGVGIRDGAWLDQCVRWTIDVAEAMAAAHEAGVVHRDLKPSNVLIDPARRARVIDFGVALSLDLTRVTHSNFAVGSDGYQPPERLRHTEQGGDPRGDVFSLGVTLYELATGTLPFLGATPAATRSAILEGTARSPRTLNAAIPPALELVIAKAIEDPPRRRYASMTEFASDLRRVLAGEAPHARPRSAYREAHRFVRRHPGVSVTLLVVGLLAILVPWAILARRIAIEAERAPLVALGQVEYLLTRERELWPAVPSNLEGKHGFTSWLEQTEALLSERPTFERERDALRARAKRTTVSAREDGGRAAQLVAELAACEREERFVTEVMATGKDAPLALVRGKIATLRRTLDEELGFAFAASEDERRHAVLLDLLDRFDRLARTVAGVEKRRELARECQLRLATTDRLAWEQCRNELAPVPGWVPLGRDPRSGLPEFAVLGSGTLPVRAANGDLVVTDDMAIVLVLLPAGTFAMGCEAGPCPNSDPGARSGEGPCHAVALGRYAIGKYEITKAQWRAVMELDPSALGPDAPPSEEPRGITVRHPVENVTWAEAVEMLRRLGLELPTEAQWENAARAGTHAPWPCGAQVADLLGFAIVNEKEIRATEEGRWKVHAPIGTLRPNAFGLHDTIGNVAEWCRDGDESYRVPPLPGSGERLCKPGSVRMTRGSAESYEMSRVARRVARPQGFSDAWLGLRAGRTL